MCHLLTINIEAKEKRTPDVIMYKILGSLVQRFDMVKNIEIKHVLLLKTLLRTVTNTLTVLVCNFQAGATALKKKKGVP